ncbi:hypothetical protein NPIL_39601 [Nephila pilipes]|uniref:Uncharacterized protein n=1 Tax=Nephila pilipes TaxID=299642 RepID=A0A8X6UTI1_NEPPI|nr:hypothetical protein NPIL_39601 [Nephila pilipes]
MAKCSFPIEKYIQLQADSLPPGKPYASYLTRDNCFRMAEDSNCQTGDRPCNLNATKELWGPFEFITHKLSLICRTVIGGIEFEIAGPRLRNRNSVNKDKCGTLCGEQCVGKTFGGQGVI